MAFTRRMARVHGARRRGDMAGAAMTAETLHAPTLRRVIEMLDHDIQRSLQIAQNYERQKDAVYENSWRRHASSLRAFRERLERRELANAPAVGGASYE